MHNSRPKPAVHRIRLAWLGKSDRTGRGNNMCVTQSIPIVKAMAFIVAVLLIISCTSLSDTSRTGNIHYVRIDREVSPAELLVKIGDEIRWVNLRPFPARVVFRDGVAAHVSCRDGFTSWGIMRASATIKPDEYASLCFSEAGVFHYEVRLESSASTDVVTRPGTIQVG